MQKKIVKILRSYIRNHGIPESIRTDHGSGFHSDVVKEFCKMRGIKHILTAVGDHWSCGLVERSIQTIKRKLGTEKLDPNFKNLKSTLQQTIDDIRKTKHSTLKVSPFELHFGRKPNTEFSLARDNVVHSSTSAQGLERNLLTPEQRSSQDYSRDRAKVVPRGASHSPEIPYKFKPLFGVGERIADSQPYKALENLAKAANTWKQWKRNMPPQQGQDLLRELAARNSDLANSLKSGITKGTLRFYDNARDTSAPTLSHSQRMNVSSSSRPKKLSKTRKLEKLVLQDPLRVKIFWKVLDRKSGKPLFKLAKIKITRVTDHTYITDKGKVYRKNHLSLRHNFNHPKFSATPGTVGERLQRRIAPRPQSQLSTTPATRQTDEPLKGKVIDLTAESSSEDSLITGPQLELVEAPVTTPQGLAPVIVTSQAPITNSPTYPALTSPTGALATPQDQPETSDTAAKDTAATGHLEVDNPTSQPSSESNRSSNRSKKPTRFYGDPLRHSVKSVTDSDPAEPSPQQPNTDQVITTPFTLIVRKVPFPRTKEQTAPFKKTRIEEHDKTSRTLLYWPIVWVITDHLLCLILSLYSA